MGLQLSGSIQLNGSIEATVISSSFFGDLTTQSGSNFIPFISTTELKERLDNPTPAFPFTGSANISGSANINGTIVLSTVSSSFNFADDAAAASGGIALGGLYHTTGSIKIRLV